MPWGFVWTRAKLERRIDSFCQYNANWAGWRERPAACHRARAWQVARVPSRWLAWFAAGLSYWFVACGDSESPLARQRGVGGTSSGGATNQARGGTTQVGRGGDTSVLAGGRAPDEPPGETVLTITHGIVDAERSVICFTQGTGEERVAYGSPQPPAGLAYGESLSLQQVEGFDLRSETFAPVIITGDLDQVDGLDCEQAIALAEQRMAEALPKALAGAAGGGGASATEPETAGAGGGNGGSGGAPTDASSGGSTLLQGGANAAGAGGVQEDPGPFAVPSVRLGELPTVPAGSLGGGRSYLLVATGCAGYVIPSGANARAACGERYARRAPTLAGVLVALSRKDQGGVVRLQVVHASLASGPADVYVVPSELADSVAVALDVEYGGVSPRVPEQSYSSLRLGFDVPRLTEIQAWQDGGALFGDSVNEITRASGLSALSDGRSYALLLLGPSFDLTARGPWNPRAVRAVATNPLQEDE